MYRLKVDTITIAMSLELSNTLVWLPRLVTLLLGTCHWNCWSTWNGWVARKNFQNNIVQGDFDKHKLYPVLCDMLQKNYKNKKMKLNTREKIGSKLFFTRQILLHDSTFLCVNWLGFSLGLGGLSINWKKMRFFWKPIQPIFLGTKNWKNRKKNQTNDWNSVILKQNGSKIMSKNCRILKHCH